MDKPGYTPGPWSVRRAKTPSDGGYDYGIGAVINGGEVCIAEAFEVVRINDRAPAEANARLIAAAPDLVDVVRNFEVTGPDADGLVWLVLHGNGTTGRAMVNLGTPDQLVAQVALHLEKDRRAALSKATGGSHEQG